MWTHWLCHQHASTRSSPAQIKHWPQKSKKPHGRKSPSHHLLDKNKVTEGRVYWEDKTWKWKAFRLKDCLFISHLTLQTRPSTLLWFPQRASWLPAQSEPTGQETEEQNTERWVTAGQLQQPVNPLSTFWLIRTKLPDIWHFTED